MIKFFSSVTLAAILFCSISVKAIPSENMIARILEVGDEVVQNENMVEFTFRGIRMMLIFDKNADRMRLVSPIASMSEITDDLLLMAMEANFHSALDARYAVSNEMMWSTFIHPLNDLSEQLFDSAIQQVAIAHATFGSDFTSGVLVFPSQQE